MSLDSLNLTIQAVTPPDGLAHTTRKQEILDLPTYLRVNAAAAGSTLSVLVVQDLVPDPTDQDKIWIKTGTTTSGGVSQRGCYKHDATLGWLLMAGIGVYVGDTAPTDTDVLWLNTSVVVTATQQTGLYYYNGAAWIPIANPGLWVGTTAPTDTARPWLNTTDSVSYLRGLYVYESGNWVLKSSLIIQQAAAPTGTIAGLLWLKTTGEGGLWRFNGTSWLNATTPILASGQQTQTVVPGATPPNSDERAGVLWAKTGDDPVGLFYADIPNSRWESINPIAMSNVYNADGTPGPAAYIITGLAYSVICPTIGTAVFAAVPSMHISVQQDSEYNYANDLKFYVRPDLTTFDIGGYTSVTRTIFQFQVTVIGRMRIPF